MRLLDIHRGLERLEDAGFIATMVASESQLHRDSSPKHQQ